MLRTPLAVFLPISHILPLTKKVFLLVLNVITNTRLCLIVKWNKMMHSFLSISNNMKSVIFLWIQTSQVDTCADILLQLHLKVSGSISLPALHIKVILFH